MFIDMIIRGILGAVMGAGFDGVKKLNEKKPDKNLVISEKTLDVYRSAPDVWSREHFEKLGIGDEYDECLTRFNEKQEAKAEAKRLKKKAKAEAKHLKKAGRSSAGHGSL